jgi:MFS family permease
VILERVRALRRYASLLSIPGVRPMVVAGIVGRLPLGMTPLAIVLLVRGEGDSYAVAGLAVGAYSLATAIAVPRLARWIDQHGQARVLIPLAALYPATAVALTALADARAGVVALLIAAALVGATLPPLGACVRTLWGELAPAGPAREVAYALESSLQEIMFVAGPLLVALLASTASVATALLAGGAACGIGTLWFALTRVSRSWRPSQEHGALGTGALRVPAVLTVVLASVAMGAAFGAVEVIAPAFAEAHGHRAAAGVATGAFALGSLIGGVAIAMTGSRGHPAVRFRWALVALALALLLPLAAGSIAALAGLLLIAGLPIAPGFASAYSLVNRLGRPGSATESFAWISTAVTVGAAAGTALAGAVVSHVSLRVGIGLSAAMAGLGAAAVFVRRWSLAGA